MHAPLSGVVTTFNNAATLARCLDSLAFCDEIVVLDSGSDDATLEIAQARNARIHAQPFAGYGPQKQAAIDLASHDWILLLDADEFLDDGAAQGIVRELEAPRADGYRLERQEWLFWRWPHRCTRGNRQLRLFRKSMGGMNAVPVHAAPEVRGRVIDLPVLFRHYGEPDLATRVEKINRYSSGLLEHTRGKRKSFIGLRLLVYPSLAFLKLYVGKRYFLNGWAGFFAARTQAFYAFLKYAKVMEAQRR
ncbi:glycosyltransferase family 2 protein [Solilutibacter silvestris]|uniref:Glycosyl transferase family 2 n=1 Tax=Solilutibacter silvestris TaxID=1645665 RepID=A0A2K1Q0C3_9GAMM|nr:glycosyltransferase family 2 protein [Lysobacter silvestris]PNS08492.1 Glycosyl transferase family 2 [Lysobacter silvestris]